MNHKYSVASAALLAALAAVWPGNASPARAQLYKAYPKNPGSMVQNLDIIPMPKTGTAKSPTPQNSTLPPASPFNNPYVNGINNQFNPNFGSPFGSPFNNPYANPYANNPYAGGFGNPYLNNPYGNSPNAQALSPFNPIVQYQMGQLQDYLYFNGGGANPYPFYPPVVSQYGYYGNPWSAYPPFSPFGGYYQFGPWMQNGPNFPWNQFPANPLNQPGSFKAGAVAPDPANILK